MINAEQENKLNMMFKVIKQTFEYSSLSFLINKKISINNKTRGSN